jgi:signal transduction histidine kinase/ActR/RegA family two-component response regulator
MGALMRSHDWSATPLSSPETWPQSLRTTVRLLLTTQHPMFIWWGPELIQFYNDAYRRTMGPERHPRALGQPGRECWAEIWDIIGPQIEHVLAGKGATWHEDQLVPVTRHGRREDVWWTYGYSPIDDEDGVGGVLVICNDITAEHRAAEALKQANLRLAAESERLRQLFRQAPSFMCVLRGPHQIFEFTNTAYLQLVGHRDLVGKPIHDALPELEGQGFFELLDRVYATGEPFVGREMPIRLRTGPGNVVEEHFIDFVYQPIIDADGKVSSIFVAGSNVTAAARAQAALLALNETLEIRVQERTRELMTAEEALRQAQKMEAVGQLTGGLAHDFNNLLTTVIGNLELLDASLSNDGLRKRVQAAGRAAQRGADLTAHLLAFSRRQHLSPRTVNLNVAVSEMREMAQRTLAGAVEVQSALSANLWPALADPTQVEVSLLNLAINARDAMPVGGTVVIATRNVPANDPEKPKELTTGDYVSVSVSDTGEGMTPEVLSKAMDPFFTTKELGKGTGLGLSQVYGLARQSGGTVRIKSTPGAGTRVEIFLPRAVSADIDASQTRIAAAPAPRHRTVLIVDDQDDVREIAAAHIEALGYRSVQAANGHAALGLMDGVDLLLIDEAMPGMSGTEVIRGARQRLPDLPIILMTGYADADALGQDLQNIVLLKKPFRLHELRAALDAASSEPVRIEQVNNVLVLGRSSR